MREPKEQREDVLTTTSDIPGFTGYLESFLRRFRNFAFFVFLSPLVVVCIFCVGSAIGSGFFVFNLTQSFSGMLPDSAHYLVLGCGAAIGYLTYGLTLMFLVPLVNFVLPIRVKPFRGPWYSLQAVPWYFHNALTYMVRYTFLELVTPTPLTILFYRLMGMKIGKGVVINTTNISDPSLITLGDYVTVGGSATIFAHYGQKGYLIIAPVTIGDGANIGLKASVMGGVTIGKNATIKPHAVLLPKTVVADDGIY